MRDAETDKLVGITSFAVLQIILWSMRNNGLEKTMEDINSLGLDKVKSWPTISDRMYLALLDDVEAVARTCGL